MRQSTIRGVTPVKRQRFTDDRKPRDKDLATLRLFILSGVSPAVSYGTMTRDRYHVELCDGVSDDRLLDFCERHLKGSPLPSVTEVTMHGKVVLPMLQAAEKEGLVKLTHVPAEKFTPEMR